jgi:hypothetical protein
MTTQRATLCKRPAIGDIKVCGQGGRAVSNVILSDTLNLAEPKRQYGLRTGFFRDAQRDGVNGQMEVEADGGRRASLVPLSFAVQHQFDIVDRLEQKRCQFLEPATDRLQWPKWIGSIRQPHPER